LIFSAPYLRSPARESSFDLEVLDRGTFNAGVGGGGGRGRGRGGSGRSLDGGNGNEGRVSSGFGSKSLGNDFVLELVAVFSKGVTSEDGVALYKALQSGVFKGGLPCHAIWAN